MSNPIHVLLVDDQALMRQGLKLLLDLEDDIKVIGDLGSGEEAIRFVAQNRVDVILMDVRMQGISGIEATRHIRANHPDTAIVILTTFEDESYLFDGLTAGAAGYLLKDTSADRLAMAIRSVASGDGFLQPEAAAKVVTAYHQLTNAPRQRDDANRKLIDPLTDREFDVLAHLVNGMTNREIAEILFLTEGTVKNYVTNILSKLAVTDRTQATLKAKQLGLA